MIVVCRNCELMTFDLIALYYWWPVQLSLNMEMAQWLHLETVRGTTWRRPVAPPGDGPVAPPGDGPTDRHLCADEQLPPAPLAGVIKVRNL